MARERMLKLPGIDQEVRVWVKDPSTIYFIEKTQAELTQIAYKDIKRILLTSLRENEINGNITLVEHQLEPIGYGIKLQLWYNPLTHTVYMEYDLNRASELKFNNARFSETFEWNLKNNFHEDTYMWLEIIHPEDGYADTCDSAYLALPTPFTIGYWTSIMGRYEFLEDPQEVYNDATNFINPSDEIEHGFPTKKFTDFCELVDELAGRYRQTSLTEAQKNAFIAEMYTISTTYDRSSAAYRTAVNNLKNRYSIKTNIANQIPQMFNEYNTIYNNFFERSLSHNIDAEKFTIYLTVSHADENPNDLDIYKFNGLFNEPTAPHSNNNDDDIIEEEEMNHYN